MKGGLYRGYIPNLIRNSVISATELASHILPGYSRTLIAVATLHFAMTSLVT